MKINSNDLLTIQIINKKKLQPNPLTQNNNKTITKQPQSNPTVHLDRRERSHKVALQSNPNEPTTYNQNNLQP